ncbi:MAG: two-component regulator propeller domain-containing protein [Gracilimonas sp.]|nr:two-component regulator propeller domain-containing protein [Gracilimonas sp.]
MRKSNNHPNTALTYSFPRKSALILIWLFTSISIEAQFIHDTWTSENGLNSYALYAIHESSDGFLWIGSNSGISVFDGQEFKHFNKNNSGAFKSNQVKTIFEDREGIIWIGTSLGGLVKYENGNFKRPFGKQKHINQNILAIEEDKEGNLLVGTDGGGLAHIFADSIHVIKQEDGLLSNHIKALYTDKKGTVFVGSIGGGLSIIKPDTIISYGLGTGFPQSYVSEITPGKAGELWISTNHGVFRYRNGKFKRYDFIKHGAGVNVVQSIMVDKHQNIWAGTQEHLLIKYAGQDEFVSVEGFDGNHITGIVEDRESNIWVVGWPSGLHRFKSTTFKPIKELKNINGLPLSFYKQGSESYWFATNQELIYGTPDGQKAYKFGDEEQDINIEALLISSKNEVWLAISHSFIRFKDGQQTQFPLLEGSVNHSGVNALFEKQNGEICAAMRLEGFICINPQSPDHSMPVKGLTNNQVYAAAQDSEGTLWIGTAYGLNKVKGDSVIDTFTEQDGLSSAIINSLYVDSNNTLWVGTSGGGLYRFQDGVFFQYDDDSGLGTDIISDILEDNSGKLWLSGVNGLYRASVNNLNDFAEEKTDSIQWEFYNEENGLQSSEITGSLHQSDVDNKIYVTTRYGVSYTDPEKEYKIDIPPLVHIGDTYVDFSTSPVNERDELVLGPGALSMEIRYTGISLTSPEKINYRYRLRGFNEKWNEVGDRRSAFYTNLDPGSYEFEVKAQNRDGVWSKKAATLPVIVKPAYYETAAFRFLILLLIAGTGWGLYKYRKMNEQKVERIRTQIAHDLHDEIGSNIGSIVLRTRMLSSKNKIEEEDKKNLLEIDQISRETAESMRDIIWLINSEQCTIIDLVDKLKQTASILLGDIAYNFESKIQKGSSILSLKARRNITLIFKEALHNIVKHSGASEVWIKLTDENQILMLSIKDNGHGFNKNEVNEKGLGLKSMRQRAETLEGEFLISSNNDRGTELNVSIPIT